MRADRKGATMPKIGEKFCFCVVAALAANEAEVLLVERALERLRRQGVRVQRMPQAEAVMMLKDEYRETKVH
jgi:hypothetical protein